MADVPATGVPRSVLTPTQQYHVAQASRATGVPEQLIINMLWRESGIGSIEAGTGRLNPNASGAAGVQGIAQINMRDTGPALGVTNAMDDGQAIVGMATYLRNLGTGGHAGVNGTLPFDMERAVVGYNTSPTWMRQWERAGRDYSILPTRGHDPTAYTNNVSQGVFEPTPWHWDAQKEYYWRQNDEALGYIGPLSQTNAATGLPPGTEGIRGFWNDLDLAPAVRERLDQGQVFLNNWVVSNPNVEPAIRGLQLGPDAYPHGDFPWTQPGAVPKEYGEALQYYGYMPSNLRFNAQTNTWDPTANPVSTEGPWGTAALSNWVQDSVANPNVSEGQRWYVQQIGGSAAPPGGIETWDASPWGTSGNANTNWTIGLGGNSGGALSNEPIGGGLGGSGANVATAGVDVGNWLGNWARQYFQPAADRGIDVWDATPDITTWDATVNSPAATTVWDATTGQAADPGIQVWSGDVTNWVPASGTWGTSGLISPYVGWQQQQHDLIYNPNTQNWGTVAPGGFNPNDLGSWDPTGGYTGPGNPSLPPPGTYSGPNYPGSAILPPVGTYTFDQGAEGAGPGYEGSYGLTNPGDSGLANAIGASQLENYYATMAGLYKGDIAIAAAPPPVTYGNNNPGTGNVVPASNVNTNLPGPTNPWIGWDMNFVNLY